MSGFWIGLGLAAVDMAANCLPRLGFANLANILKSPNFKTPLFEDYQRIRETCQVSLVRSNRLEAQSTLLRR